MITSIVSKKTDLTLNLYQAAPSLQNFINMVNPNEYNQFNNDEIDNNITNNNNVSTTQAYDENFNIANNTDTNLNDDATLLAGNSQYMYDNSYNNQNQINSNNYTTNTNNTNEGLNNIGQMNSIELLDNFPLNNHLDSTNLNHQSINVNLDASPIDEIHNITSSGFNNMTIATGFTQDQLPQNVPLFGPNSNYNDPQQSYTSSSSLYSNYIPNQQFQSLHQADSNPNLFEESSSQYNDSLVSPVIASYQNQHQIPPAPPLQQQQAPQTQQFQQPQLQVQQLPLNFNSTNYDNTNSYPQMNNSILDTNDSTPSNYEQNPMTMSQTLYFDNPNPQFLNDSQIFDEPKQEPSTIDPLNSLEDLVENQLSYNYNTNNSQKRKQSISKKTKKSMSPKNSFKSSSNHLSKRNSNSIKQSPKEHALDSKHSNQQIKTSRSSSVSSKKHIKSSSDGKNRYRVVRGVSAGGSSTRPPKEAMENNESIYLPVELNLIGASKEDICYPKWSKSEKEDRRRIVRIERLQQGSKLIVNFSIIGNANENPITLPSPPNIDVIEVSCLECEVDNSRYYNRGNNTTNMDDYDYDSLSSDDENLTNTPPVTSSSSNSQEFKNEYENLNINNPNNNSEHCYQYYITSVEVVEIVELLIGTEFKEASEKRRERGRIRSNLVPFWCKKSISSRMNEISNPSTFIDHSHQTLNTSSSNTPTSTLAPPNSNSNSKSISSSSSLSTNSILSAPTSNQSSISSASSSIPTNLTDFSQKQQQQKFQQHPPQPQPIQTISKNQEYRMELAKRMMAYEIRKPRGFDKEVRILKWEKLIPALKRALHSYYTEIPQSDAHLY
ncbi:uncharacterized protein KGF55_000650 [Candida pseudojiufengensis]|uniref:uncharacterized protein n=1 Tax=Candida pseudojiufengensis TaxID=497109 RepID=UPI002224D5A5|nr:uncharacterized protein KGF55_000650 [Candida pseudojiufengensis]KAI5966341.1 hypothetical protein KGF55_000650 [Candida pseudojiufengensis]